jgi:hypothetical protein
MVHAEPLSVVEWSLSANLTALRLLWNLETTLTRGFLPA